MNEKVIHSYLPVTSYLCTLPTSSLKTSSTIKSAVENSSFMQHDNMKVETLSAKHLAIGDESLSTIKEMMLRKCDSDQSNSNNSEYSEPLNKELQSSSKKDEQSSSKKKSNVWIRLGKLQLTKQDKAIIINGQWLNDLHVCMAQVLIKTQFPSINGLVSPLLQLRNSLADTGNSLQIIHIRAQHWALVSTLGCQAGEVNLYDSLYTSVSTDTAVIIAQLIQSTKPSITVHVMNVARQTGSQDCALFAIAYMTSLAHGKDPTVVVYDQNDMRCHLVSCFEKHSLTIFNTIKKRRPEKKQLKSNTFDIYCYCRLPDTGERMVCCDLCSKWYHIKCISEDVPVNDDNDWHCTRCASK